MNIERINMPRKKNIRTNNHIIIPLILLLLLFIGGMFTLIQTQKNQNFSSNAATVNCTVNSSQLTVKQQEQQLLDDLNNYRAQNGLSRVSMNATLKQAAAWQTTDMAAHNSLSHTDSLSRATDKRLRDCGYDINNGYGENISNLSSNPDTVFNGWKSDPSHNQILLLARFTIAGVDMEKTAAGQTFWTLDLGEAASSPTSAPSNITPTEFCLGSCPISPTSPSNSPGNPSTQPITSGTPSISPSINPCTVTGHSASVHALKYRRQNNGAIGQFLLALLQFIISLLQQLLGGTISLPINPGVTPTPPINPGGGPTVIPSGNPCPISSIP